MASKTGIAMLSIYGDEDDDMEDLDEEQQVEEDEDMYQNNEDSVPSNITPPVIEEDDSTLKPYKTASPEAQINISTVTVHRRSTLVDHGHEEVAMSPEAEEGEIKRAEPDFQTGFDSLQVSTQTTFQSSVHVETSQTVTMHITVRGSDTVEVVDEHTISGVASKDVVPLDEFLPSPPDERCSDELQDRINKFLALKRAGKSFNAEVRNKKAYRNPDFLLHAVRYQDIDQIGSCFSKDVFDPHGYDKSDYYDEIEADMKREAERKEQERKKSPKVEFHTGGMHLGTVPTAQKIGLSAPGVSTGGASGLPLVPVAVDAATRDVRQNKKSKWDKVDGDQRSSVPSRGQDPASNAGAGYAAFAQQRRRETEYKRSSDRRRS